MVETITVQTVTKVLATNIVANKLLGLFSKNLSDLAVLVSVSVSSSICNLLSENKAFSEPENKPAQPIKKTVLNRQNKIEGMSAEDNDSLKMDNI
jgi:hypothetical protein